MPIFSQVPQLREPVDVDGVIFHKSDWMEFGRDPNFSPNVFLVEQPPNVRLRTHFHRQNQFQLFIDGDALFGRHAIGALTVHYAGAYTGYGPLTAGPRGLTYLTLRPVYDIGKLNAPEDSAAMVRGPKRQLSSKTVQIADHVTLAASVQARCEDLIALQPDHIAARLFTLPPGARQIGLDPRESGGQFYVVLAGSLRTGDQERGRPESIFVRADEPAFELNASKQGVQVVCLQFAPTAEPYQRQYSFQQIGH